MKTFAVAGLFALAACGGTKTGSSSSGSGTGGGTGGLGATGGSGTTGGCAQALCGTLCCSSSAICLTDPSGNPTCAMPCTTSSDCTANSPPCCQTAFGPDGKYESKGVCVDGSAGVTTCLCSTSNECPPQTICAPVVSPEATPATGYLTGPYLCRLDDGRAFDGCDGLPCDQPTESCATDKRGNKFCSDLCTANSDCKNPGVACCATPCDAGTCCGLCGD